MDAELSRAQVRRRILDNLRWGQLPHRVIEPLPPLVAAPSPPSSPAPEPVPPRAPIKRWVKQLIAMVPFLGKVAIALLAPLVWPLHLAGALANRLQNVSRRIDHLIRSQRPPGAKGVFPRTREG